MDLNLGKEIKRLRLQHSVTQEELAEHLGISFQAVSKWETGTTMPDIALLPKISSFFGVRIDELFSVSHEDELERIDSMLQKKSMTDTNYLYAKRVLDSYLKDNSEDTEAIKRYAKVYLAKSNEDMLEAGRLLESAMQISPVDEEIYSLYRWVRGGDEYKHHSDDDWFIRVCEPYFDKHPQNTRVCAMLTEAMAALKYYDRARALLDKARFSKEEAFMKELLLGDISAAQGDIQTAKEIWDTIPKTDWRKQYEIGERFNRLNEYDKAIEYFINSYELQTPPHKMDMLYSLAFLFQKLGRLEEAAKEWELIAESLMTEYGMTEEDNDIKWARREIAKLRDKL